MTTNHGGQRRKHFSRRTLSLLRSSKILGVRAGSKPHRTIGIWMVVVENRLFVRSWSAKPGGWFRTFLEEPLGTIAIGGRSVSVRAVHTRSRRLIDAVSGAYALKYNTSGSRKYVRGFKSQMRTNSTIELCPK